MQEPAAHLLTVVLEAKALQGIDGGTLREKAVGLFGARRPSSVKIASQVGAHDRVFQDALPEQQCFVFLAHTLQHTGEHRLLPHWKFRPALGQVCQQFLFCTFKFPSAQRAGSKIAQRHCVRKIRSRLDALLTFFHNALQMVQNLMKQVNSVTLFGQTNHAGEEKGYF